MRALYGTTPTGPELVETALRMRIDRFAQQTGIVIRPADYLQWHRAEAQSLLPRLFSDEDLVKEERSNVGNQRSARVKV
jgi:hypothetical protein